MHKLKSCPFCNNSVKIEKLPDIAGDGDHFLIYCDTCRLHMYSDNITFLITKWNSRSNVNDRKRV